MGSKLKGQPHANEGLVDALYDGTSRPAIDLPVAPHRHRQRRPPGYEHEGLINGLLDGEDAPSSTLIPLPTGPSLKTSNYQFVGGDSGTAFEFDGPNPPNGASAVFGWLPAVNPGASYTFTVKNLGYLPFVLVPLQVQTTGTTNTTTSVTAMPSNYGILNGVAGKGLVGTTVTGSGVQAGTTVASITTLNGTGIAALTLSLATTSSLTGTPLTFSGIALNGGYQWVTVTTGQEILVTSDGTSYYTELLTPLPYIPPGAPKWYWCAFNGPALGLGTAQAQPYITYSSDGLAFTTIKNPAFTNANTQTISSVVYPLFARDETIFKSPVPNANGSRRYWMTFSEGAYSAFGGSAWVPSTGTGRNLEAIPSGCTNTKIGIAYSDDLVNWTQAAPIDFSAYFTANSIPFNNVFSTLGIFCDGVDFWLSVCWYQENAGTNVFPFPCFPVTFGQGTMSVNTTTPAATNPLGWLASASYPHQLNNYDPTTGLWHRLSTVYDNTTGPLNGTGTFAGHSVSNVGPSSPSSYVAVDLANLPDDFDGGSVVRLPNGTWRFYAGIDVSLANAYSQFAYYWTSPDLYNWVGAAYASPPPTGAGSYWVTTDGGGSFDDTEQPVYTYGLPGTIRWSSNGGGGDGYDPDAASLLANYWVSQQGAGSSDSSLIRFFH